MADWQQLDLGFAAVLDPISSGVSSTLSGVAGVLQAGIAILDVLASFLVVNSSPLLAAVEILRAEILNVLQDLEESGVYGLFLVPETLEEYVQYRGGYGKFQQLFLESLNDVNDLNRPQVPSTGALGGVILYLNSEDPLNLILNGKQVFDFFSRPFSLGMPAPINLQATPVYRNPSGSTVKANIVNVFTGEEPLAPNALLFEWQEPRYARDFTFDFFARSKFILERSKSREGVLILDPSSEVPPTKVTPLEKRANAQGRSKSAAEPLLDAKGRPVYYWEPVDPSDPFIELGDLFGDNEDLSGVRNFNFISGSYAYLLEVPPGADNAYYYRVRAVPRDTVLEPVEGLVFDPEGQRRQTYYVLKRGDEILSSDTAPASAPVKGFLPDVDTSFDLTTALLNTYRAAYLLRFDQDVYNTGGDLSVGSGSLSTPLPQSLFDMLDPSNVFLYENGAENPEILFFTPALFIPGETEIYSASLENLKSNLVAEASEFDPFGGVDEFIQPRLDLADPQRVVRAIDRIANPLVQKIATLMANNEGLFETFRQIYTANETVILSLIEGDKSLGVLNGDIPGTRDTVFTVLQLINSFTAQGSPPNWEAVRVLADIFPDAAEGVNRLFDIIVSFEAVLQDVTSELQGTIQGVQDRLATITAVLDRIDSLIDSLSAILSLDFDINLLYIPPAQGGTSRLIREVLTASNPPDSNPRDYFMAIALVGSSADPFSLIFGV